MTMVIDNLGAVQRGDNRRRPVIRALPEREGDPQGRGAAMMFAELIPMVERTYRGARPRQSRQSPSRYDFAPSCSVSNR
jgi:hypothetical protein